MDDLRNRYADLRKEYNATIKLAYTEPDPERMKGLTAKLLELNQQMSQIVSDMMNLVVQTEGKVNLDQLRTHLSDELVAIQSDAQKIQKARGDRKVVQSLYDQTVRTTQLESTSLYMYMGALVMGLLFVMLAILKSTIWVPALPPISTPALGMPGQTGL